MILGGVPDAQDRHCVRAGDPVNDEIGGHDHQFSCPGQASWPAAAGEHHQTVAEQKLASGTLGCDRIVGCDLTDDPPDIGQGLGTPDDRQRSARLGRRGVELALGEPQKPSADVLVRYRSRVRVRLGDGRCKSAGFGFVILDQGGGRCHLGRIAHGRLGCTSDAIRRFWPRVIPDGRYRGP